MAFVNTVLFQAGHRELGRKDDDVMTLLSESTQMVEMKVFV